MAKLLFSWIGSADLRGPDGGDGGIGPLAQAVESRDFNEIYIVTDYPKATIDPYLKWLKSRTGAPINVLRDKLTGPTHFGDIHDAAVRLINKALEDHGEGTSLTFHLSPGTPAMAAVWIILAKTRFEAELIESSQKHGVQTASVPFEMSADYLPTLLAGPDRRLRDLATSPPPEAPEFSEIIHRSPQMAALIQRAQRVAARAVPVLIEGETGTGKELFARAIHTASTRKTGPFVAVNCGAIPATLLESELFGHVKGAFTGANGDRTGRFMDANGGTLFLDELGELPPSAQVALLRVLNDSTVTPVGSGKTIKVDVRIVAATNRNMIEEVAAGTFREDLFFRLAVAVLKIPALRGREGDTSLLIDHLLSRVNRQYTDEPGYNSKKLSAGARNLLLNYSWPGNVRELDNTLQRAALWSEGTTISQDDVKEAILPLATRTDDVLNRQLGSGFNLPSLIENVARHYLGRAMDEAGGNKTKAAELVGLPSYQTLTNWLRKYGVEK
jgi:DNA-binding NtrC family response regulator